MRLAEACEPTFARHETFHPRYGWFRKAFASAALDPQVFKRKDAPVVLGVGKNMVRAIRFWGFAAKLIVEPTEPINKRSPELVPSRFGLALFGEEGWDPFMEDPGTLWLLHWRLLAPPCALPVWWAAFNEFQAVEFRDDDLQLAVVTQLEAVAEWELPSSSSLKKDLSALLRTYAPVEDARRVKIDDLLDCPLRDLALIRKNPATGRYRFSLGHKPTLPAEIVAAIVFDYISRTTPEANTATLSRIAYEPGSPGRALKLNESELQQLLEQAVGGLNPVHLVSPTGGLQLAWDDDPGAMGTMFLNRYYGGTTSDELLGPKGDEPINDDLLEAIGLGRDPSEQMRQLHLPTAGVSG